jgi:shikimate kinase
MQLVFLYGPPGVGKYTVGRELASRTGFKLLHNHLSVNLVSAVFDRDSDSWVRLLQQIRREIVAEAAEHDVDLILTGAYRGSAEQAGAWRTMLEPVLAAGGTLWFVQLTCAREALLLRLQNDERRRLDKLVDVAGLEGFDLFASAPVGPQLCLDTTHLAPPAAAAAIIAHCGLRLH